MRRGHLQLTDHGPRYRCSQAMTVESLRPGPGVISTAAHWATTSLYMQPDSVKAARQ